MPKDCEAIIKAWVTDGKLSEPEIIALADEARLMATTGLAGRARVDIDAQISQWRAREENLLAEKQAQLEQRIESLRNTEHEPLVDAEAAGLEILGAAYTDSKGKSILRLFAGHNVSTVQHEMAHAIRKQMYLLATGKDASSEMRTMYAGLTRHYGAGNPDAAWTRKMEEAFARDFEKYLLRNKIPLPSLKDSFDYIRERMLEIYSDADALGVPISDGMRAAFDRMFDVPLAQGEMNFRRALNSILNTEWEREFYTPPVHGEAGGNPARTVRGLHTKAASSFPFKALHTSLGNEIAQASIATPSALHLARSCSLTLK